MTNINKNNSNDDNHSNNSRTRFTESPFIWLYPVSFKFIFLTKTPQSVETRKWWNVLQKLAYGQFVWAGSWIKPIYWETKKHC